MPGQIADSLADRYHEIMRFRGEALRKYRANEMSVVFGPPARLFLPSIGRASGLPEPSAQIGPLAVRSYPPIWHYAERLIQDADSAVTILEIGPGRGILAAYLRERFGSRIRAYYALERDPHVSGPYHRVDSISAVPDTIDIAIASEVAEHMTADAWYANVLVPLEERLSPRGSLCLSVPNPISPGGIARDFTHVQAYPWYDLYAILRLCFAHVDVVRTFYAWSAQRVALLLPRMLLCPMIELDWCDGIVCVASRPASS